MKKILLFLIWLFYSGNCIAQDPELFQTWYLTSYTFDPGITFDVDDIAPHISPEITIDSNLDFTGNAACNGYFGNFSYDSGFRLVLESFTSTLIECDYKAHDDFESDYFHFFEFIPTPVYYFLYSDTSGNRRLLLEVFNGNLLNYQNVPLSISEQNIAHISVFPNPVSDRLFISSENTQIENVRIYSISGIQLLEFSNVKNSIDVSSLSEGVYFIEILSEEERSIQKFIKL